MTVEIPIRRLSRGQENKLFRSKSFDGLAEELVEDEFDLEGRGLDAEWWDLRHPDRPTKYEVKSTATEIGEKYPGEGRFRIWEDQTQSLIASDANAVAWYAFVLLDENDGEIRIRRMKPSTVNGIIEERGGWNRSGHESMGKQHKIPWRDIYSQ